MDGFFLFCSGALLVTPAVSAFYHKPAFVPGDTEQSIVGRIKSCVEVSQDGFSRLQKAVLCLPKHLPEQNYSQLPGEHLAEGLSSQVCRIYCSIAVTTHYD